MSDFEVGLEEFRFHEIPEALEELKKGKMVIVVDDGDVENDGTLVAAGQFVTADEVNFMLMHGRGVMTVPVSPEIAIRLGMESLIQVGHDRYAVSSYETLDAHGVKNGVSAADRALTVNALASADVKGSDFKKPGQMVVKAAQKGGVLKRTGFTEATVDLCTMAGLSPVGLRCGILNDDGSVARVPEMMEFAQKYNLKIITIADMIQYRRKTESFVSMEAEADFPTKYGHFRIRGYVNKLNGEHHVAILKGDVSDGAPVLCRIHSECLTGDALGSRRCDCGEQYAAAMKMIEKEGRGALLYMRQEGRGIGLINKLKAYVLQEQGYDTVEANIALGFPEDLRDYGIGAQILADIGIKELRLITNNPAKVVGLSGYGIKIVERVPIIMEAHKDDQHYLMTKQQKMGHYTNYVDKPARYE